MLNEFTDQWLWRYKWMPPWVQRTEITARTVNGWKNMQLRNWLVILYEHSMIWRYLLSDNFISERLHCTHLLACEWTMRNGEHSFINILMENYCWSRKFLRFLIYVFPNKFNFAFSLEKTELLSTLCVHSSNYRSMSKWMIALSLSVFLLVAATRTRF